MSHDPFGLGDRIRELREGKGWTQEDLATASGVVRPTISLIERGNTAQPRYDTIQRLAAALEVDAGELAGLAGLTSETVTPSVELQRLLNQLDADAVEFLFDVGYSLLRRRGRPPGGEGPAAAPRGSR